MSATDSMLARLQSELEERRTFADGLVDQAEQAGRVVLTDQEMELYKRTRDRMVELANQMTPLQDGARITLESRKNTENIAALYATANGPQSNVEYRSVGAYIADLYYARMGDAESAKRQDIFNRAAAHQTTTDTPGLLPEQIVAPVVNFIEVARPLVATLGPTDLGPGSWSYARVTQQTQVAKQAGEKTELASRKMLITKTALGGDTFGGYVNISKQDIHRSSPAVMDMVINSLAEQYAIETEEETADVLWAAATTGPTIPTGVPTPAVVAGAIWTAAGSVFAATKGQGTTVVAVSPDMLGLIGPIFPPINPQNAYSSGFNLPMGQGPQATISGLSVIMSAGLDAGQILVYSTAAARCFEHTYGNMTVDEPSVWGVQVGYAGDFDCAVYEPLGIIKVTKTP